MHEIKKKRLKPDEKNEVFYHVFKAFQALSTFSNVCQINIAAKDGIPSCRVSSSGIQKKYTLASKWIKGYFCNGMMVSVQNFGPFLINILF